MFNKATAVKMAPLLRAMADVVEAGTCMNHVLTVEQFADDATGPLQVMLNFDVLAPLDLFQNQLGKAFVSHGGDPALFETEPELVNVSGDPES